MVSPTGCRCRRHRRRVGDFFMTKKRFVKLVMGLGESRNEAERAAAVARRHRIPYGAYFPVVEEGIRAWASVRMLSLAFQKVSVSMEEAVKRFNKSFLGCRFQSEAAEVPRKEK